MKNELYYNRKIKVNVSCETIVGKIIFILYYYLIRTNVSCETLINTTKIYYLRVFAINGLFELFEENNFEI